MYLEGILQYESKRGIERVKWNNNIEIIILELEKLDRQCKAVGSLPLRVSNLA